jgi:hypothetical protein
MASANIFFFIYIFSKITNASQNILTNCFVSEVFNKNFVCRGWGRSGSFHPLAAALVVAMQQ